MARTEYATRPPNISTMPPGVPYIIGNEAAERFSFYGMRSILTVFMTAYLVNKMGQLSPMGDAEARAWFATFVSAVYFLPILGAILAEGFLGKYNTILWLSVVYCLGHLALAFMDTAWGIGFGQEKVLAIGLGLIALGSGGIKPCVSANVGDQFGDSNKHLLSKVFGWFYFSINAGSFTLDHSLPAHAGKPELGTALGFRHPGRGHVHRDDLFLGRSQEICPHSAGRLGFREANVQQGRARGAWAGWSSFIFSSRSSGPCGTKAPAAPGRCRRGTWT